MNRFQPKIVRYESLPSTNTEAARFASAGAAEGLSILADEQTAGRGRLQRTWVSPRGAGLYLSILLRPLISLESWPLITFVASLAVNEALVDACDLATDIKWPNDILSGERKLCGILSETVETTMGRAAIVGIGINLSRQAFAPELADIATSVEEEVGRCPDREVLLTSVLENFGCWYGKLQESNGAHNVREAWTASSSYARGKAIKVMNGNEVLEGITDGLEMDGALRLRTSGGEIKVIRAGDVLSVRSNE